MRLPINTPLRASPVVSDDGQKPVFGLARDRVSSQKELAEILMVTTRHLRRWEMDEANTNHLCSRPCTHADLWRLFQHRGNKAWDRAFAERLGMAEVFARFEAFRRGYKPPHPKLAPREAGARGGTRTPTDFRPRDFKSLLSTIPSPGPSVRPSCACHRLRQTRNACRP